MNSVFDKGNNKKDLAVDNTTPIFSIMGKNNGLAQIIKIVGREKALEPTQSSCTRKETKMDRMIREISCAYGEMNNLLC